MDRQIDSKLWIDRQTRYGQKDRLIVQDCKDRPRFSHTFGCKYFIFKMVSGIARNKTEKEKTHFLEAWSLGGDRGGREQNNLEQDDDSFIQIMILMVH